MRSSLARYVSYLCGKYNSSTKITLITRIHASHILTTITHCKPTSDCLVTVYVFNKCFEISRVFSRKDDESSPESCLLRFSSLNSTFHQVFSRLFLIVYLLSFPFLSLFVLFDPGAPYLLFSYLLISKAFFSFLFLCYPQLFFFSDKVPFLSFDGKVFAG